MICIFGYQTSRTTAKTEHFSDTFVCENVAYGYDVMMIKPYKDLQAGVILLR